MSHRTRHLPPTNPVNQFIRELRYHEASRQLFAIALIIIFAIYGAPVSAPLFWAGVAIAMLGILVRYWASGHVKKNKQLATDGPYAFVRHPLYVGNILALVGFVMACQLWWSAVLTIFLLLFYYPPAIEYEDLKLQRLFGRDWEEWRAQTKALLPKWPKQGSLASGWSLKQSTLGNGEPIIVAMAVYCAYHLFTKLA